MDMTIIYNTRGTMLPAMSPYHPGSGKEKSDSNDKALNGGLPTAFDYGLLYEEDDRDFIRMEKLRGIATREAEGDAYAPKRCVISDGSGTVEILFADFPTCRKDHGGRPIRSWLYLRIEPQKTDSRLMNNLATWFSDGDLATLGSAIDSIINGNAALVAFRAMSSTQKCEWLCDKLSNANSVVVDSSVFRKIQSVFSAHESCSIFACRDNIVEKQSSALSDIHSGNNDKGCNTLPPPPVPWWEEVLKVLTAKPKYVYISIVALIGIIVLSCRGCDKTQESNGDQNTNTKNMEITEQKKGI